MRNNNYIKTLIRQILREEQEYEMSKQIITPTPEWMKKTYDKFNKIYWNGELPSNISFKLNNRLKTKVGCVQTAWEYKDDNMRIVKPIGIDFSNMYKGEEWVFENLMMHEMIHVADMIFHPEHFWQTYDYTREEWVPDFPNYQFHGPIFFLKEANRLAQYGWNIQRIFSAEEENSVTLNDDYLKRLEKQEIRRRKRIEAKRRLEQEYFDEWDRITGTKSIVKEKCETIQKLIDHYTKHYTECLGYREVNIGKLKIQFVNNEYTEEYHFRVLPLDDKCGPNIEYQTRLTFTLKAIKEKPLTNDFVVEDLFQHDDDRVSEIEDEYEEEFGYPMF